MNPLTDWTVCVASIGTIYRGPNTHAGEHKARQLFKEYVRQSRDGLGNVAGEPVSLFHGERAIIEYEPIKDN